MIESQYTAHELIKTLISCYNLGVIDRFDCSRSFESWHGIFLWFQEVNRDEGIHSKRTTSPWRARQESRYLATWKMGSFFFETRRTQSCYSEL